MSRRDAVVTGMGAVTPLGSGAHVLLERWCAGEHGFSDGLARCDEFDARDLLTAREARRSDRFTQFTLAAADEAVEQAGWGGQVPFDPYRVGCVIGTALGGDATFERQLTLSRERGPAAVSTLTVPLLMSNAAAAAVSLRFGLHGPSSATVSACASGADAVAAGVRLIRSGEVDAVVVGGAESAVSPFVQAAFACMGALSKSGLCRPFDARRDGFVLGEGAAVLVLEDEAAAAARRATVLGRVAGIACTSDAHHMTAPDSTARPARRAIEHALADAGVAADEVDYVNAHGTGTPLNDRVETEAIRAALGPRAARVPVSSTKSAVGHSLGAAGAVELVSTLLALRAGVAPPTLSYGVPEPGLDLDYVGGGPRALTNGSGPLTGVSNSFGFGGHNVVLVVQAERATGA